MLWLAKYFTSYYVPRAPLVGVSPQRRTYISQKAEQRGNWFQPWPIGRYNKHGIGPPWTLGGRGSGTEVLKFSKTANHLCISILPLHSRPSMQTKYIRIIRSFPGEWKKHYKKHLRGFVQAWTFLLHSKCRAVFQFQDELFNTWLHG